MNLVKNWPSKIAGTAVVNLLTLSRLSAAVGFLAFVLGGEPRLAILMLASVYGSDILDGLLARKWKVATRFGACFDLVSDIFFVLLSYEALVIARCLPMWMLPMAMFKFAEFISTSYILSQMSGGNAAAAKAGHRPGADLRKKEQLVSDRTSGRSGVRFSPVFDRIGRLSGILYMCVPAFVMLLMRFDSYMNMNVTIALLSLSVCLLATVSSVHRIGKCVLAVRSYEGTIKARSSQSVIV